MYEIDLTHPGYFHQMKKLKQNQRITISVNGQEPISSSNAKLVFAFNVLIFLSFYFAALFGITYYFSN